MDLKSKINETMTFLTGTVNWRPEVGLILGSGLGALAEEVREALAIPYREIPHFPVSTVEGHAGKLVMGNWAGKKVAAMQGRFHFYEGYSMADVTYPVRVMREMGVKTLVITNAAGGINPFFRPGDLMLIGDHINLMGDNPLRGPNDETFGPRFPDMSRAYARDLRDKAHAVAASRGIRLREGVYAGLMGPSYETPAEIRYLRAVGADAVGMSTVPEVIVANHCGIQVLGISCITNMAAGILHQNLSHDEVMAVAEQVRTKFSELVKGILAALD